MCYFRKNVDDYIGPDPNNRRLFHYVTSLSILNFFLAGSVRSMKNAH